jgi:magnesium transporter
VVKRILRQTDPEMRKRINEVLHYPKDSAGSIMTIEFVDLKTEMTVADAFARIRKIGVDKETIYTCYVLDRGRKLIGVVSLKSLVISPDDTLVEDIMHEDPVVAHVDDDQEEVMDLFTRYGYLAIPVVDNEFRLVGIVTVDDILEVIEEETTEDIERMGGVIDSTDKEYLDMSVWQHVKARLPWLFLLMCSYFITGGILRNFEHAMSAVIELVIYMPMLMGTAGNAGGQVSVTVIRSLSVGDMDLSDIFRVIWKEIRVSVISGVILALVNFGKMMLIDNVTVSVAIVVSITVLMTVIIAKLIGAVLPMIAKKIGLDPAVMASPLITTLCDAISLLLYFKVAEIILGI